MKKNTRSDLQDDLRPEYDLRQMLKTGVRGKYADQYRTGTNVVLLAPDVAQEFPNDETVNEALRLVIQLRQLHPRKKTDSSRETHDTTCQD